MFEWKRYMPLLLFILVIVIVLIYKSTRKVSGSGSQNNLEKYVEQLQTLKKEITSNANPKCMINIDMYQQYKKTALSIINDPVVKAIIDKKQADQKTIDTFVSLSTALTQLFVIYDKLPYCADLCFQGTYSTQICICDNPVFPYPIIDPVTGKVYCWEQNCSADTHQQFNEGQTKDPSGNSCICLPGYVQDPKNKSRCIESSNISAQLENKTQEIKDSVDQFQKKKVFCDSETSDELIAEMGKLIVEGDDLLQTGFGNISQQSIDDYQAEKKIANGVIVNYKSLPQCSDYCGNISKYDPKQNLCICNDPNSTFDNKKCVCNNGFESGIRNCVAVNNSNTQLVNTNTKILAGLQSELQKCVNCIPDGIDAKHSFLDSVIEQTEGLKQDIEKIIGARNIPNPSLQPSLQSLTDFQKQYESIMNLVQTKKDLPSCELYCWQARYDTPSHDCVCNVGQKMEYDGKFYCNNCSVSDPNSQLQLDPLPTQDFSQNVCICKPTFNICGDTKCEDCNAKLAGANTNLSTDQTNINNSVLFDYPVKGEFVQNQTQYFILPNKDVSGKIEETKLTGNMIECILQFDANKKYHFASYEDSGNCNFYLKGDVGDVKQGITAIQLLH